MILQCIALVYITPKTHPSGALKLNKVQRYVRVINDTATVAYQPFTGMEFIFHNSYVMEHLCHKGPRWCSTCGKHFPTSWTITVFITWLSGFLVTRSLVLCACFVAFALFLLTIVLSVLLWFTDSDYAFDIFKFFFQQLSTL
jgi:hypothetical protein